MAAQQLNTSEEELLFSARLLEEGDSSGFIYMSRNDDSGMLMASSVGGFPASPSDSKKKLPT